MFTPEQRARIIYDLRVDNDFEAVEPVGEYEYVAVHRLAYHWTMMRGLLDFPQGYEDNWCYATLELAMAALAEWRGRGFEGEPVGWHRNPRTGRRRKDGDPATEYVAH